MPAAMTNHTTQTNQYRNKKGYVVLKNIAFRSAAVMRLVAAPAVVLTGALASAHAVTVSTQWNYEISVVSGAPTPDATAKLIVGAASFLGSVGVGTGQDTGTIDKDICALRSQIDGARLLSAVISNLKATRQSTGRLVNGIALTMRYTDKRGSAEELVSVTNLAARRYEFYKGNTPSGTGAFKVAASDLLMAPYAFLGKPAPNKPGFLTLSDGKGIRQINLTPKTETVKVAGRAVNAVRLSVSTSAGTFDLWVRAEDSYPIRMRVELGAKYGAVINQIVKDIPAGLVSF